MIVMCLAETFSPFVPAKARGCHPGRAQREPGSMPDERKTSRGWPAIRGSRIATFGGFRDDIAVLRGHEGKS
jgi:hypothetical protein